jgi:ribosomal protein L31
MQMTAHTVSTVRDDASAPIDTASDDSCRPFWTGQVSITTADGADRADANAAYRFG